ncbi:MAG TPA: hypothetical protein VGM02_07875 [Acidobacteriaceae bacterium]|jgi:hypothetical protein
MKYLRVVDQAGNGQDHETEFVPRIGERIVLIYGHTKESVKSHYFRVKDVALHLDQKSDRQVAVLVEEETDPIEWER